MAGLLLVLGVVLTKLVLLRIIRRGWRRAAARVAKNAGRGRRRHRPATNLRRPAFTDAVDRSIHAGLHAALHAALPREGRLGNRLRPSSVQ